jgi:putative hydrolase of the HAD superfamily
MRAADPIDLVLVDFDDTLVRTAPRFAAARRRLVELLVTHGFPSALVDEVHHGEVDPVMRRRHGYGPQRLAEAFEETYRVLCHRSARQADPDVLERCRRLAAGVVGTPPPIDGALEALGRLAVAVPTVLYTQAGDVDYQIGCLREAGALEVVGEDRTRVVPVKTPAALRDTLAAFGVGDPARACMVGNSLRSDVNPALAIGAHAILIEQPDPWHHDVVEPLHSGFRTVRSFPAAVDLLLAGR